MIQILDKLRRSKIDPIGGRNPKKEAIAGGTKMRGREVEKPAEAHAGHAAHSPCIANGR
jgi:hypothetical protein